MTSKLKPLHPRQVVLDVTMTNGVKNRIVFTLHAGDFSFVDKISVEGIEVAFREMTPEDQKRRSMCMTQEVGHKIPVSTLRRQDGRVIGSCSSCFERVNIDALTGPQIQMDVAGVLRDVFWPRSGSEKISAGETTRRSSMEDLQRITKLERSVAAQVQELESSARDLRRAKAVIMRRIAAQTEDMPNDRPT